MLQTTDSCRLVNAEGEKIHQVLIQHWDSPLPRDTRS